MTKCTSWSLNFTSTFSILSPRMEISQAVDSFQPVTSCLSCSISISPSCFKFSAMPLVLKRLLKNHSLLSQLFWDTWDAQDALCSCYRSQHPASSKSREKALYWMFLPFFVSVETFFYLWLLEVLIHFQFFFWTYLHSIIFLEQMVDSHRKKLHLSGIGHESYQDGLSSEFLENPSTSLMQLWSDGTKVVLFWGGCSCDALHGKLCKVPPSL